MSYQQPTQADLDNEGAAVPLLEEFLQCKVDRATDPYATYDYNLLDEGYYLIGYAEYRRRRFRSDLYDTVMVSAHKLKDDNDLPTFFCVEWDDMIGVKRLYMDMKKDAVPFSRTVNHKPGDKLGELVVFLNIDEFTVIKEKE